MKLAATVIYVDSVPDVLDFYQRALGVSARFVDLDVQLPGRGSGGRYQFAVLDFPVRLFSSPPTPWAGC